MGSGEHRSGLGGQVWTISRLGGPLFGFFFVQNLASLACLAIIGRLGDAGLAGVGAANAAFAVVLALLFGFDTGVQAIISRATGAGERRAVGEVLTAALVASGGLGLVLAIGTWAAAPRLMAAMLTDPAAVSAGADYLRGFAPALAFLAITTPINACWIGSGRPGATFAVTFASAPIQIGLTALLVLGAGPIPSLGAAGAGLAGALGAFVAIGLQAWAVQGLGLIEGRFPVALRPRTILAIIGIGWPVSVQQSLWQLGLMIAFIIVARLGTASAAVVNVLASLMTLPIQSTTGLGIAAATLVGQALGRRDPGEARAWGWRTAIIGALLTGPFGLAAAAAPEPLLGLFLRDPATLDMAVWPARVLGLGVGLDAIGRIIGFALRGAGATKWAAGLPFASQWLVQLPLMWWVGVGLGYGVLGITWVLTGITVVDGLVLARVWAGGSWLGARVGVGRGEPSMGGA